MSSEPAPKHPPLEPYPAKISTEMRDLLEPSVLERTLNRIRTRRNDASVAKHLESIWRTTRTECLSLEEFFAKLGHLGIRKPKLDVIKQNYRTVIHQLRGPPNFLLAIPVESIAITVLRSTVYNNPQDYCGASGHSEEPTDAKDANSGDNELESGGGGGGGADGGSGAGGGGGEKDCRIPEANGQRFPARKEVVWTDASAFLGSNGVYDHLSAEIIASLPDGVPSRNLLKDELYQVYTSGVPFSIYHGTPLCTYRRMTDLDGAWLLGASEGTGDLAAQRAIYFASQRAFPLYWALTHALVEYPRVLIRGSVMKGVVIETTLPPTNLALVAGSQDALDRFIYSNLNWSHRSGEAKLPPAPVVIGGWESVELSSFDRVDVLGGGNFYQIAAVGKAGEALMNQEQSRGHLVKLQIE